MTNFPYLELLSYSELKDRAETLRSRTPEQARGKAEELVGMVYATMGLEDAAPTEPGFREKMIQDTLQEFEEELKQKPTQLFEFQQEFHQ